LQHRLEVAVVPIHKHLATIYRDLPNTTKPCGSGLARDIGVSANITVGCADAIAGKPAPTGFFSDRLIVGIKKTSRRRPLFVTPLAQALPDQQL
jgi:hypothetical protein